MLSTNVAKAAKVDVMRTCPSGKVGETFMEQMWQRFYKVQDDRAPKMNKPLAKPDDKPKNKRGGKKFRKMKDRIA